MAYFTSNELGVRVNTLFPPVAAADVDTTAYNDIEPRSRSFVEAYVTWRYSVPFTTVPQRIKDLALDYGAALMAERKFGRDNPAWNQAIQDLKGEVRQFLMDLQKGIAQLDHETGATVDEASEKQIISNRSSDDRVFTLDDAGTDTTGSVSTW